MRERHGCPCVEKGKTVKTIHCIAVTLLFGIVAASAAAASRVRRGHSSTGSGAGDGDATVCLHRSYAGHVHQKAATELRRESCPPKPVGGGIGPEAAQTLPGYAKADVRRIYAGAHIARAAPVAARVGGSCPRYPRLVVRTVSSRRFLNRWLPLPA